MSITKSQNARVMSEEAIQYLCNCINLVNSLPTSVIDNLHLADNLTFSSTKIDRLLTILKEDCNKYTDSIVANLSRLELKVVTDEADMIEHNKLYLIKKAGETSYSQYVIVTNDSGVDEKILLGTCDISMTDYLKITDAESTYCKITDFNTLTTEVTKVKNTLGTENLTTTSQTVTGAINELKTNFQDGVDTLYDTCVECGATPENKTPTAIAKAIKALSQSGGAWWKQWVALGGLTVSNYSTLDEVLLDNTALDTLMKKHDSVDYLITELNNNDKALDIIVSDESAMQYIGTYDYCSDKMLADSVISVELLASDYWQYILKDHVPTMTSNTSPEGICIATSVDSVYNIYNAFDKKITTAIYKSNTSMPWYLGYGFSSPIIVKKVKVLWATPLSQSLTIKYKVQASNNGNDYVDITNETTETITTLFSNGYEEKYIDIKNDIPYTYYRIFISYSSLAASPYVKELDFFGRSLNVSVPKMTSNISPSGQAIASDVYSDETYRFDAYKAFDKNTTDEYDSPSWVGNGSSNTWVGYIFDNPICVKRVDYSPRYTALHQSSKEFKIQYSDDGNDWIDATGINTIKNESTSLTTYSVDITTNTGGHRYWRLFNIATFNISRGITAVLELQFYGVDYSE